MTAGQGELVVQAKRRVRALLLALIGVLFVVSVPWYRETGGEVSIVWGLPDWVAVALGCYVGVAVLNSLAWLLSDVVDPEDSIEGDPP